ncbi:hypothetical protein PV325_009617 [Microctonus aethiopoides]|nr:hypothetical protein PV325_009617 [Microctonus aethiopoides]
MPNMTMPHQYHLPPPGSHQHPPPSGHHPSGLSQAHVAIHPQGPLPGHQLHQQHHARQQPQSSKNSHLRYMEIMESEELMAQKKLRGECIQLEDVLAQFRKEQNLAANEQTGPINGELRHLMTSLQNHNQ